jgi:hypothetical protein
MSMPDLMTEEELRAEGFVLQSEDTARHVQYPTWRYKCHECGLWFREIEEHEGRQICLPCKDRSAGREEVAVG